MAYFRKEFKLRLAEFASCCHGFCFWRTGKNISPLQVSSAYSETSQQHNNNAKNDIISINSGTHREHEVRGVTNHNEVLENGIGEQRNFGFIKEESVENEPDFQETRF